MKLDALRQAANAHNVQLSIHPVAGDKEIVSALDMAQALGATALNVLASPLLSANRNITMEHVAALHLPATMAGKRRGRWFCSLRTAGH